MWLGLWLKVSTEQNVPDNENLTKLNKTNPTPKKGGVIFCNNYGKIGGIDYATLTEIPRVNKINQVKKNLERLLQYYETLSSTQPIYMQDKWIMSTWHAIWLCLYATYFFYNMQDNVDDMQFLTCMLKWSRAWTYV